MTPQEFLKVTGIKEVLIYWPLIGKHLSLSEVLKEYSELYATIQYNQALEDIENKIEVIQSNSNDDTDAWYAIQSALEEIEILKLKK